MPKQNNDVISDIMMDRARFIREDELEQLLSLYEYLIPEDPKLTINTALKDHWKKIVTDENIFYLVVEEEGRIVSSCP